MKTRPSQPVPAFSLRQARPADFDFLWRLTAVTMRDYVGAIWGWDDDWQRRRFLENFEPGYWKVVNAFGRDIGGVAVRRLPKEIFLADLQILPPYQNLGIGTAIIERLKSEAKDKCLVISLNVLKSNPRARRLYERLGFHMVEQASTPEKDLMVILPLSEGNE